MMRLDVSFRISGPVRSWTATIDTKRGFPMITVHEQTLMPLDVRDNGLPFIDVHFK